jgi:hypothetical protein
MVSVLSGLDGAKNVAEEMDYKWDFPIIITTEGHSIEPDPEWLYVM